MMKKAAFVILILSLTGLVPLLAQETAAAPPPESKQTVAPPSGFTYNPEGRRDPFKDLLAGRGRSDKTAAGEPEVFIDDLILFGIVKNKSGFTAMIGMPQGFPMFVHVGDKFTDGFVLSINESQVVLRKTQERGIPLIRPRDIIKEITEEL
jgi:Tfp pilus assembly protein PilP